MVRAARLSAARRSVLGARELRRARSAVARGSAGSASRAGAAGKSSAWIDNAADEDWISEESNPNGIVYYGKPRQYGIEMTYRF